MQISTAKKTQKAISFFISLLLFISSSLILSSCGSGGGIGSGGDGSVVINGTLNNCNADSIYLFRRSGQELQRLSAAAISNSSGQGMFTMNAPVNAVGFYFIGINARIGNEIILGDENTVNFNADCRNFKNTVELGPSKIQQSFKSFETKVNGQKQRINQLSQNAKFFGLTNPGMVPQIQEEIKNLQAVQSTYLDSITKAGGFMGKIASLYYFPPYQSDPSHSKYQNELEYYAREYLGAIDFNDATLTAVPQFYTRLSEYCQILTNSGLDAENMKRLLSEQLAKASGNANVQKAMYVSFINGLQQSKSDLFADFGKEYLGKYGTNNPGDIQLQNEIAKVAMFRIGSEPPAINLPTPNGGNFQLSSLKGKVVLLDFWASWCRPCRRDNPHVVGLYNKYKSKGFDILGVSLDRKKEPWVGAIQQDGLTWNHVSDLQGWKSSAAAAYGVSSIPATFLLDKEGKILAKNLRGAALDNKLKEIFGF